MSTQPTDRAFSGRTANSPDKIFQAMIAWGRYAGLLDFNANIGMVLVPNK